MDFVSICAMGVLIVMSVARAWNFKEVEIRFRRKEKGSDVIIILKRHMECRLNAGL